MNDRLRVRWFLLALCDSEWKGEKMEIEKLPGINQPEDWTFVSELRDLPAPGSGPIVFSLPGCGSTVFEFWEDSIGLAGMLGGWWRLATKNDFPPGFGVSI